MQGVLYWVYCTVCGYEHVSNKSRDCEDRNVGDPVSAETASALDLLPRLLVTSACWLLIGGAGRSRTGWGQGTVE